MKTHPASLVLKSALSRIQKKNPSVSIRALASKLNISHVFLSKILSGKVAVPEARLKSFVKIFQLDPFAERELDDAMVSSLLAASKIQRIVNTQVQKRKRKAIDVYEEHPVKHQLVLENWYELPILDYLTCENLPRDADSIARKFSLKPSVVVSALKKMSDASLIEKDESHQWVKKAKFIRFPASAPSGILKKYYTDVFRRATEELSKDSQDAYDRRLIINFSIATKAEKIPDFKERLSQFLYDLSVEMAEGPTDEVYHLTLGLVPLTKT